MRSFVDRVLFYLGNANIALEAIAGLAIYNLLLVVFSPASASPSLLRTVGLTWLSSAAAIAAVDYVATPSDELGSAYRRQYGKANRNTQESSALQ